MIRLERALLIAIMKTEIPLPTDRHRFVGSFAELATALKGKIDWRAMLNHIQGKLSFPGGKDSLPQVTPTDQVHVQTLSYLVEAASILENTPISAVQNWFGVLITVQLKELLPEALQREIANYTGSSPKPRKATCSRLLNQLPAVQGRIYIDTHFSPKEKAEAEMMVRSLRVAFEQDLANHTEWLDERTRRAAMEKLAAIKQVVGYEDWIVSDQALTADYFHLNSQTIVKGKFFESALVLRVDARRKNLATLHQENATNDFIRIMFNNPTTVNAFYDQFSNSISKLLCAILNEYLL